MNVHQYLQNRSYLSSWTIIGQPKFPSPSTQTSGGATVLQLYIFLLDILKKKDYKMLHIYLFQLGYIDYILIHCGSN